MRRRATIIFAVLLGVATFGESRVDTLKSLFTKDASEMPYPSLLKLRKLAQETSNTSKLNPSDDEIEAAWFAAFSADNNAIPSRYLHRGPLRQRALQRAAYDDALDKLYAGNIHSLDEQPIPGLFTIIKNGFALVHDYVLQPENSPRKALSLAALHKAWQATLAHNKNPTSKFFQDIHLELAAIADLAKGDIDKLAFIKKLTEIKDPTRKTSSVNGAALIIYGNPDISLQRNLSPFHFVEELCEGRFPMFLSFFNVLSTTQTSATKKDPHWSLENGTYNMIMHDLTHNHYQAQIFNNKDTGPAALSFLRKLCQIQKRYASLKQFNESIIITNALFMASHEYAILFSLPQIIHKNTEVNSKIKTLADLILKDIASDLSRKPALTYGSTYYKTERRDHEYILKNVVDEQGEDFLPLVPYQSKETEKGIEVSERPFPYAYYKNKPDTLIVVTTQMLEEDPLFIAGNNDSPVVYLPKHQQAERNIPKHFTNYAKAIETRKQLMTATLLNAYARFWTYATKLLQQLGS